MALKTFEHVLILADDVDKTKNFYVDILGLEVGYRPDFPFKGYWLYLKDNKKAACIHLAMRKQDTGQDYYIGKKEDVKSGSGAIDHVAFNADDIEGMKSKLESVSIPLIDLGCGNFFICDLYFRKDFFLNLIFRSLNFSK